ncbi:MAG TPA: glycosyltransferase, partial [Candidatus Nanoarchaeia archaeon]|nr:glycosyltransferase [Candidatus Nanoarchaeia archaeon]
MRIGFLTTYFYPVAGGAENNCFYLAKELSKKHEVHIFTSDRKDSKIFPKEETIHNLNIHRFRTIFRYRYYLALYPGIINAIRKADLDILHVHSLGFMMHDIA